MKTLFVLRHAKSSWQDDELEDHDRLLNKRGEKEAPRIGKYLHTHGLTPALIITSSARRAKETAYLVSKELGFDVDKVVVDPVLYHANPGELAVRVRQIPEPIESAMIVGHNPCLETFASELVGREVTLKTATLVVLEIDIAEWAKLNLTGGAKVALKIRGKEL